MKRAILSLLVLTILPGLASAHPGHHGGAGHLPFHGGEILIPLALVALAAYWVKGRTGR